MMLPHALTPARTWVWADQDGVVVGYYALAAHKVARDEVPSKVGRGGPVEIPAVLLARLALSDSLRGQGLEAVLVAEAMQRVVDATQTVAARLVVVDALHERVARFYEALGFRPFPRACSWCRRSPTSSCPSEARTDPLGEGMVTSRLLRPRATQGVDNSTPQPQP